jgi:hypothetical protein
MSAGFRLFGRLTGLWIDIRALRRYAIGAFSAGIA